MLIVANKFSCALKVWLGSIDFKKHKSLAIKVAEPMKNAIDSAKDFLRSEAFHIHTGKFSVTA